MNLYFVTRNKKKFDEINFVLRAYGIKLRLKRMKLVEIQSDSLKRISIQKAKNAYERLGKPLIVEDSGLFIKALNGFPGTLSSHVFKLIGNDGILKLMKGERRRDAEFISVITYFDGKNLKSFTGKIEGRISKRKMGKFGFGFDPIFIPKGYAKTFAQAYELKLRISHRRKAAEKFAKWYAAGGI